ncbi:MAG: GTP pyrophosphokinase [Muribaculum sp.]|nr:GTP pyrophosphokinase [Muribaculum sp.]
MNQLVKLAYKICATAHAGQTDKVGMPYHLHPDRVAARCSTDAETIVALLHDTIEDTDITPEYLLCKGFPQYIVDGVLSVTKREGESYEDFVARAKQNPIGRMVKIHDLEDNMDLRRLDELTDEMVARQRKYLKAYHFLKQD